MKKITRDFIADDNRHYKFRIGHLIASSLSGYVCGVISASIIWMVAFEYLKSFYGS